MAVLTSRGPVAPVRRTGLLLLDASSTTHNYNPDVSLKDLFTQLVKERGQQTLFYILDKATDDQVPVWHSYSYVQTDDLAQQVAYIYASKGIGARKRGDPSRTVAILADSCFELIFYQLATLRLGHTLLLLSPNNSCEAVVHLLRESKSIHMVYDKANATKALLVAQTLRLHQDPEARELVVEPFFSLGVNSASAEVPSQSSLRSELLPDEDATQPAFIVHSSGTTSFPKLVYLSTGELFERIKRRGPLTGESLITAPLYHAYAHQTCWWVINTGRPAYILKDALNADAIIRIIQSRSEIQNLVTVPFVLKLLAEHEEGPSTLARLAKVQFAGSSCPSEMGDRLVQAGVNISAEYGLSEAGACMSSARDFAHDKDWDCLRVLPRFVPYLRFENRGTDEAGPYEMVVDASCPSRSKSNRPDGSWATSDLFKKHPTIPHGYFYVGRLDDTLVHYNGEKTNPVPMELTIRSSPLVKDSIMFGAGRAQPGILIIPSMRAVHIADIADQESASSLPDKRYQAKARILRDMMVPIVEKANQSAPTHSRIVPEMIKVLEPDVLFLAADKGSLKRPLIFQSFADEINQLYEDYDAGRSMPYGFDLAEKVTPTSLQAALELLHEVILHTTGIDSKGKEDNDLIHLGVDSIAAMRIRNTVLQRAELMSPLPGNIVFQHPTVNRLAQVVLNASLGDTAKAESSPDPARMISLLAKLQSKIKQRIPKESLTEIPDSMTVVLTGSTGSLGAHILHQLASRACIGRIVCLNRASTDSEAWQRTNQSLATRRLPSLETLMASRPGLRCEAFAANLALERLGLAETVYTELEATVTTVVHNGWPVNFQMSIDSFTSVLQGSVNLINLVTQSRGCASPHFVFSSSISAVMRREDEPIAETESTDPAEAMEMGYAQSKWVNEELSRVAGIKSTVMRIGQMVGDSVSGIWNETEADSLRLQTAQTLKALPRLTSNVSWLPVDHAGWIVAALVAHPPRDMEPHVTLNVVNDAVTRYEDIVAAMALQENLGSSFDSVELSEWIRRLEKEADPEKNGAFKLLDHYKREGDKSNRIFATDKLRAYLTATGEAEDLDKRLVPISAGLMTKFVTAWRDSGFFS